MTRPNYLETSNPFNLAAPPPWFLKALAAYDAAFVIFPSVKEPVYRTGRYGKHGHGLLRALANNPDTAIFVAHRIWPWKSLLPQTLGADWNRILLDLPDYDTQRFGNDPGAALDEAESRIELADDRRMQNELDAISTSTYNVMKLMTGSRVGAGRRHEGAGAAYNKLVGARQSRPSRQAAYRPSGAGAGAMFVGR
jgi:hypothetical protein